MPKEQKIKVRKIGFLKAYTRDGYVKKNLLGEQEN